ncbi:MAG: hypothetical protein KJP18_03050 [Gemmatimonadetes bacterium]|nr:hypothetical protein [Gemmatimonadota bacterium]NNK62136.1 hypothetical protein [Gemmatimonadota bacterium]
MGTVATGSTRTVGSWKTGLFFLIFAVVGLGACASSGSGGSSGSRNVLTHEQLAETQAPDVLFAIQQLRPRWLQPRGQSIQGRTVLLFIDGAPRGEATDLRGMQISNVEDITYYTASEAGFRFGSLGGAGGVLEVRTRR